MIEPQATTAAQTETVISNMQVSAQIKGFIVDRFPTFQGPAFDDETPLLEDGSIDSLGMIELINFLEESFSIEMDDDDFQPENLETMRALTELVLSKVG